jgi:hypothetical protein
MSERAEKFIDEIKPELKQMMDAFSPGKNISMPICEASRFSEEIYQKHRDQRNALIAKLDVAFDEVRREGEKMREALEYFANISTPSNPGMTAHEAEDAYLVQINIIRQQARAAILADTPAKPESDIPPMTLSEQWDMRGYLAVSHEDGKCHIYGDDGELQCNNSARHGRSLDFRRESIDALLTNVVQTRIKEYVESQKTDTPAKPLPTWEEVKSKFDDRYIGTYDSIYEVMEGTLRHFCMIAPEGKEEKNVDKE